jgi:Fe2+ or Zn2+ uptake regulation protein
MPALSEPDEILARLFGSLSRARILDLLISQDGRSFYQREIIYEAGLSLQPTQRELNNLLDLGIVRRWETGGKVYYEIDTQSPIFKPLSEVCGIIKRENQAKKKGE